MIKGKAGKEPEGKYEQRKIPLYKSYFARMIFIMLVFFIVVISISFLYLYVGMKNSLKKRTDTEKLQTYSQLAQNIDTFGNEMELLALRTVNNTATTNMVVNTEGTLSWSMQFLRNTAMCSPSAFTVHSRKFFLRTPSGILYRRMPKIWDVFLKRT